MARLVVFLTHEERSMMCAPERDINLFGREQEKLLELAYELFREDLKPSWRKDNKRIAFLKKKIFGIAKSHGFRITWYGGEGGGVAEPDRFLISGRMKDSDKWEECLAFIQC